MMTYTTVQGDMWDSIAYQQMGDVNQVDRLMAANPAYLRYFVFPAGIVLTIPDVEPSTVLTLPPWKQVRRA